MFGELKALGKETLVYGLSTVLARLLNFLLLPFYTHYFLPAEYGIATILFSYAAFLNIVFQYGMDQAYLREAAERDEAGRGGPFSTAFWSLAASSAALAAGIHLAAGPLAAWGGARGHEGAVRLAAWVLALDALASVPFADLRLAHRAWTFVGVKTANIVINVAANVVLIAGLGMGVRGVFAASLAASAGTLVLLLPVLRRRVGIPGGRSQWRRMAGFGGPLVPAGLGAMTVQVIDRPILLKLTDAATVGVYQANYRLAVFMQLLVNMFDQAWRPFFLERASRPDAPALFGRVFTYFLLGGGWALLALALFIEDLVKMPLLGRPLIAPAYWAGLPVVPVVLAAYLVQGAYVNFTAPAIVARRTSFMAWATLAGAAANIGGNLLLVPRFGMMGAAWAKLAAYGAMALTLFALGRRVFAVRYEYGRILHAAFAGLAAWGAARAAGAALLPGPWLPWAAARLGALALFPALLAATGFFAEEERRGLKRILSKRKPSSL